MNMRRLLLGSAAGAVLALAGIRGVLADQRDIYPSTAHAESDVKTALAVAAQSHKRVILDFGGNWCPDCRVLDIYFHDQANLPLLEANYVLVHVNIGHLDENLGVASRYNVPLKKGVPAVAVIDSDGKLIYSQTNGEFEAMRQMKSSSVTDFLQHWKSPGS